MFSAAMQEVENDGQCDPLVQLSPERLLKVKKNAWNLAELTREAFPLS